MAEQDLTKICVEAFPGIDSTQERGFSIQDLLNSKSNADALAKQNDVADHLGFPHSDSIIAKASLAKACIDKIAIHDSMPIDKIVERFENKVADAMLNGSGPEVQLLRVGKGRMELDWHGRKLPIEPPEMNARQKEIYDAIRQSPKIDAQFKENANAFYIMGRPRSGYRN